MNPAFKSRVYGTAAQGDLVDIVVLIVVGLGEVTQFFLLGLCHQWCIRVEILAKHET